MLTQWAAKGRLLRVGDGTNKADITYVENAADAHLRACDHLSITSPVAGQAYFIGDGQPVNLWSWINHLLERLDLPTVSKSISYHKAYRIGTVLEFIHQIVPGLGDPRITRFMAAQFAKSHYFSHEKAGRDFGYLPTISNEEGLDRTVKWYREAPEL